MSYGFIDSAFIMNAVSALSIHNGQDEWNDWEWESLVQVTQALITHHLLRIAPSPSPVYLGKSEVTYDPLYSYYDLACKKLSWIEEKTPTNRNVHNQANIKFKEWFVNNTDEAINAIIEVKEDNGFSHWEEMTIAHAWVDHSYRLKGLFNFEMIDELSFILQISSEDLEQLWKKTTDIHQVKIWSQGKNLGEDFELARDAFIASAVLRGKYHYNVASLQGWDIMPHLIRQHFDIPYSKGEKYEIPWASEYLSHLLFNSAMMEEKPVDRITHWVENIHKTQEAYLHNEIPELDNTKFDENEGYEQSQFIAKKLKIRFYSNLLDRQIDAAIRAGTLFTSGIIGLYIAIPWTIIPIAAGGIFEIIKDKKQLGKKIAEILTSTKKIFII